MKFTVASSALLKHLHALRGAIGNRNTMPILDYFLFSVQGTQLTVTADDLETTVTSSMPVEVKAEGLVCIPAKRLMNALRVLPAQHITIDVDKGHRVRFANDQGTYRISGSDAGEFPKTREVEGAQTFTIPASALGKGLGRTLWAVGNDDLRPVMAGVFLELAEDCTRFVVIDAHRMVVHSTPTKHTKADSFIVRTRSAKVLLKYMTDTSGEVTVAFNDERATFTFGSTEVNCRLVNGAYPNYSAVIPAEAPNRITVDRLPFIGAIRRMDVFANKTTHQVRLQMGNGTVELSAEDLDVDDNAREKLHCSYEGEVMSIGFNTHFLLEVMKNLSCAQVVVRMDKPNKAATIVDADPQGEDHTLVLIMPRMLND